MIRPSLLAGVMLVAAVPSLANGPDAPVSPPILPAQILAQEVFPRLNGNGDGVVTLDEYEAGLARSFGRWDRNRDGRISGIEAPVFELVMLGDRNGDGVLVPREYAGVMWRLFKSMDADGDQVVTSAEWRAAADGRPAAPPPDEE